MSFPEVIQFLLPQPDDPLQLFFFSVIVTFTVATIALTWRFAKPHFWEHKWNGGTPDDHTDDLDVDHGSVTDIWNAVATGPEKLAEVMPGTLLVIGLLGTFIGLGLVLNHASHILGHGSSASAAGVASSMNDLMGMLQGLGTKFKTSTWGVIGFLVLKLWNSLSRYEEKRLSWSIRKVKDELERRKAESTALEESRQGAFFSKLDWIAQQLISSYIDVADRQIDHRAKLQASSDENIREQIGKLDERLASAERLADVRQTDLVLAMGENNKRVLDVLFRISESTKQSGDAMLSFSRDTTEIIQNFGLAADRVVSASDGLLAAVNSFSEQFTQTLENVNNSLGDAIKDMTAVASATLREGSLELSKSSSEIASALDSLSSDVQKTMNKVEESINSALDIQKKAQSTFISTSDNLNANIIEMKTLTENVTQSITDGLKSVAESGRRMEHIGKSVGKIPEHLESLVEKWGDLSPAIAQIDERTKSLNSIVIDFLKNQKQT